MNEVNALSTSPLPEIASACSSGNSSRGHRSIQGNERVPNEPMVYAKGFRAAKPPKKSAPFGAVDLRVVVLFI
jgi:hypothetical protein